MGPGQVLGCLPCHAGGYEVCGQGLDGGGVGRRGIRLRIPVWGFLLI